jgi:hypothetical protein
LNRRFTLVERMRQWRAGNQHATPAVGLQAPEKRHVREPLEHHSAACQAGFEDE